MKKLLSLLTVSLLGVTSITNVTAFSQTNTTNTKLGTNTNSNINISWGIASDYNFELHIQLNASAWNHLMAYKASFNTEDHYGFGGYLAQYANDNKFDFNYMPNMPNSVAFAPEYTVQNWMRNFGYWNDNKSETAANIFS